MIKCGSISAKSLSSARYYVRFLKYALTLAELHQVKNEIEVTFKVKAKAFHKMGPKSRQTMAHIYGLRYVVVSEINFHYISMFHVSQSEYAQRTFLCVNYQLPNKNSMLLFL